MPAQDVARRRVRCGVIPRPEMLPGQGEEGRASSRAGTSKTWAVACQKVPIAVNLMVCKGLSPNWLGWITNPSLQMWLHSHSVLSARCGSGTTAPSCELGIREAFPMLAEEPAGVRRAHTFNGFGRSLGDDLAALRSAFGPEVDHPIR